MALKVQWKHVIIQGLKIKGVLAKLVEHRTSYLMVQSLSLEEEFDFLKGDLLSKILDSIRG